MVSDESGAAEMASSFLCNPELRAESLSVCKKQFLLFVYFKVLNFLQSILQNVYDIIFFVKLYVVK